MARGDDRVIELLNDILTFELTLINQYWLNYRMLDNWGLPGLAKVFKDLAMEEMEDADHYIERLLFLDGHPNLQRLNTVQIGEDPVEQLRLARDAERTAVERLNAGIALCVEVGDNGTRELLATEIALASGKTRARFLAWSNGGPREQSLVSSAVKPGEGGLQGAPSGKPFSLLSRYTRSCTTTVLIPRIVLRLLVTRNTPSSIPSSVSAS